ncbi:ATP-binding cassette domain-containing protein [Sedimentitalea sp. JM2-8]|uniref:Glutathione import ATP-binding protein GsiA n=1 Tax=Sedimentitalea xiamensis TaxID=3050037 RepID=A0ABT7FIX6_9RHOB|nr:oligopeptide/dipeptide ABC transporter ATP-binding protein [Sedimentitalea xiamensis]MDK3074985.1 ATP-binding cassette domain-containing protein [Sedimentitalea xiamensis]
MNDMTANTATPGGTPKLSVRELSKRFHVSGGGLMGGEARYVHAVSDVNFNLDKGTTIGIVGESGCGKSTTARLIMHLINPDSGKISLDGDPVGADPASLKKFRRDVQMVFQDSSASLNPRLTIEQSIMFGATIHGTPKAEARKRSHYLLNRVGLDPARFAGRYPHELSGGQRQRVNIARALAVQPKVVIFDEAVSALDKSVEAQVLNLLNELREEFELSYIFISHDLHVVRYISDTVMVMYLGQVVEYGPVEDVYNTPQHPYTKALLSSMLSVDPDDRTDAAPIQGDPPSPLDLPSGCCFSPRCSHVADICRSLSPRITGTRTRQVACHLVDPAAGHPECAT